MGRPLEKVLIIGRGAVGLVFGDLFAQNLPKGKFAFLADEARRQNYELTPLVINGTERSLPVISPEHPCVRNEQGSEEPFGKADLILITTKASGLEAAMDLAAPFLDENTILMSGINGILSEDVLRRRFAENTVLRTIAQKMDAVFEHGEERFSSRGELVFGPETPQEREAALAVQALFERTGIPYVFSENIVRDQWNKLMVNCGLNQVCAAFDASYGQIVSDAGLLELYIRAMEEVRAVAASQGIVLTREDIDRWVQDTRAYDPQAMPSMRQDIRAGRQSEKQLFSGTVVPLAHEAGVEVPVLEYLYEQVSRLDAENAAAKEAACSEQP